MAMNVEAEIRDLKRRVGELEGTFGFLTQQIKGVHRDLLAFQAKTEQEFRDVRREIAGIRGEMTRRFDGVDHRLGAVENGFSTLRRDLPGIIAGAVRPLVRGSNGKSRKKND